MDLQSVHMLIKYCQALDPRIGRKDDEEMALAVTAWHSELPSTMALSDARTIAHDLNRRGALITAGAIGRRYDELRTPLHQQGVTSSPRPVPAAAAAIAPAAVGRPLLPPPPGPGATELMDRFGVRRFRQAPDIACPWCGAEPGRHCTRGDGVTLLRHHRSHPSRLDALAGADVAHVARRAERVPAAPSQEPAL